MLFAVSQSVCHRSPGLTLLRCLQATNGFLVLTRNS